MINLYHIARGNLFITILLLVFPALRSLADPLPAVNMPDSISSQPESFSTCVNEPGRALSVTASGSGPFTYLWQQKKGTEPWINIEDVSGNSYTPPTNEVGTAFYRVRVTSPSGSVYSNAATVTIYRPPAFSISAPAEAVCLNSDLTVRSNIDINVWDIEWEKSSDGSNWSSTGITIPGIEHPTSSPGVAYYRLKARPKGVPDPLCSPVSDPVSVEVTDCMSLAVKKSVSPARVYAGDTITYTVAVTNRGPSTLRPDQTIMVKELLPEVFNLQSVTANGNFDLSAQTWTGIELQPGESENIIIKGSVSADYSGDPIQNVVTVVPPGEVRNTSTADSTASVTTTVRRRADLEILKEASSASVKAGQALDFTISITNKGPSRILTEDVFNLPDTLPAGYRVRNYEASEGEFNYLTGDWTEVDFTVGKTITLKVYGSVSSTFKGDTITNTASVTPPPGINDPVMPNLSTVSTPVSRQADIVVTKGGPPEMVPNEEIWYTVRVENKGPSYAREVAIADVVPPKILVDYWKAAPGPGARILSGQSGTDNNIQVTANISPGSDVTIRIRGTVAGGSGEISNTATAVLPPGIHDPTTPNEDTYTVIGTSEEELVLHKRGPERAPSGGRIRYTLQLINNTSSTIKDIQFEDLASPADSLRNLSWTAEPSDPSVVVQPLKGDSLPIRFKADIPPAEKVTVTVNARTIPGFTGEILNTASAVTADETKEDSVTTRIYKPAAIKLEKSGPEQADAGSEITYTITTSNTGEGTSGKVQIIDRLPLGSRFVSSDGGFYNPSHNTVSWPEIDSLGPGDSVEHQITLITPTDALEITNIARAGNKRASLKTTLQPMAGLGISKEAPDSVFQDSEFIYTIHAVNNGPSTAKNVSITDILPDGLEILDPDGGTRNGQKISWQIPSIPKNGVRTFNVRVKAPAKNASLTNNVSISSDMPDPDSSDNSSSVQTDVLPSADLLIEKTGPAEAFAGEEIEYQFKVTNQGPSPAENVEVSDRFPFGMQFISSDISPVDTFASPITWIIENLAVGESRSFSVRVKTPGRAGVIRNVAEVKGKVNDKDRTNNQSAFSTNLTPAADVEAVKAGTVAIDSAGVITYEILVRNNGPSTALNVQVEDLLPEALGAPVGISNGGVYDAGTHSITWPIIPAMAAGTERLLTVRVGVNANGNIFTISNTALISTNVFDPDSGNNRSEFETSVYPPADVFFELEPTRICKDAEAVTLSGGGVRNNIPGTGVYSGPGVSNGVFDPAQAEAGDHEILYTFTSPGGTKTVLSDTLHLLPAAYANAGPDMEILEGDSIMLEGQATGEVISWTPADGLSDPSSPGTMASPTETTTYLLTADNTGVCSASDEVTVFVYPRLDVPNAFTPNNDAVNDTWEIVNIEEYPNATVQVFNRNGDLLFYSRGYGQEWDGEFNGEAIPPGTYYYVIRPNGGILQPFSGSVTIIR